jgi:RND family efflux transporter MFP subunit
MLALFAQPSLCSGIEIEGYTEPYRSVDVASPEQGIVTEVPVQVGDFVRKDQVVARLDDELHVILLEAARERKDSLGRRESAEAELRLRRTRHEKLVELRAGGFGRFEEVQRALADMEIAEAELKSVLDDLADKHWQYQKSNAELRRRVVLAPMDGVIVARLKEPGEFVAPNEPNVVTIVELDPLVARFSMKRSLARHLGVGEEVSVSVDGTGKVVTGIVDVVSPVIDAQSGTIKVKIRIDNPRRLIPSGERCTIDIRINDYPPTEEPVSQAGQIAIRR